MELDASRGSISVDVHHSSLDRTQRSTNPVSRAAVVARLVELGTLV
jgi:hypothetical protein